MLGACQNAPITPVPPTQQPAASSPSGEQAAGQEAAGASNGGAAMPVLTPDPEKATIKGRLLHGQSGEPLVGEGIQLAQIYWDSQGEEGTGSFLLNTAQSPFASSDEQGYFVFSNVEPAYYVIVIGDVVMNHMVVTNEDGSNKVWHAEPGSLLEAGEIEVNY